MAVIALASGFPQLTPNGRGETFQWLPLTNSGSDSGTPVELADYRSFAVQAITGASTAGVGANLIMEGSVDGVNWAPLVALNGTAIAITTANIAAYCKSNVETVRYVRPRVTAGDGSTSITVAIFCQRDF